MSKRLIPTAGCNLLATLTLTFCFLLTGVELSAQGKPVKFSKLTIHKDWRQTPKLYIPTGKAKLSGTGKAVADSFIEANKSFFKVNPADLKLTSKKSSLLGTHYRYTQYLNGVPVLGGELVVSVSKDDSGVYLSYNATYPVSSVPDMPKSVISKNQALDTAWGQLKVHSALHKLPTAELAYQVTEKGTYQLVYKTQVVVGAPRGQWEHLIDAVSGRIISVEDKIIYKNPVSIPKFSEYKGKILTRAAAEKAYTEKQAAKESEPLVAFAPANGTALVFDADPKTYLANDSLNDASSAASFDPAYVSVTLTDIDFDGSTYRLNGPWVSIIDFDSPINAPSTTTDGDWTAKRGNNAFNDVMNYYHIDQNQRYLQSLGFTGGTGIQEASIGVDSDGASGADNSYYMPSTNQLAFGRGGVDDSEDADVILHEYGHAITHDIVPGWGIGSGDADAIGEGFGDYWGGSYSSTTTNGTTYHPEWAFSWDGHNGIWPGRDMNRTDLMYDPGRTYGAHETIDGISNYSDQLWSTPLFQAFLTLRAGGTPRTEIDTVVIESFFGVGSNPSMRDLAIATVSAASTLYPSGPHASVFSDKFLAQNIITDPDSPSNLTAALVAADQIDLAWALNIANDSVIVAYNTTNTFGTPSGTLNVSDMIPGGGTIIYKGTGTAFSHTALSSGNTYYYKVWSVLAGPTYSTGVEASANTPFTVPFTDGFESGLSNWSQEYMAGTVNWSVENGNSDVTTAHTGTGNALFYDSDTTPDVTRLIVTLDFGTATSGAELSFWHHMEDWAGDQDELRVYYKNSPAGSWNLLATYTTNVASWTERTITLPNLSSFYSIALEGSAQWGFGVAIDDVSVTLLNHPSIVVSGNSKQIANGDTTTSMADDTNFGTVAISSTVANSFTITNPGPGMLSLNGSPTAVAITGDEGFSISSQPGGTLLAPGVSAIFDVQFAPTISGEQLATISIANDSPYNNPFVFDVSGNRPDGLEVLLNATSMPEGGGTVTGTVYRSSDASGPLTVNLSGSDTTEATVPATVTILASNVSETFTVTAVDDTLSDGPQSVTVTASATGHTADAKSVSVIDDEPPVVFISVGQATISETVGSTSIVANLLYPLGVDVTVNLAFSGTATGGGTDYTSSSQIIIPAGLTSSSITLGSVGDDIDEDDETIIIDVASVVNADEDGLQRETVTITDDDDPPAATFAFDKASFSENGDTATLTATLTRLSSNVITFTLAYNGSATNGVDYTPSSGIITIPAGSLTGTVLFTGIDDSDVEGDETIEVSLTSSTNSVTTSIAPETVTISDNNSLVNITVSQATIAETGGSSLLVANLSSALEVNVTVNLAYTAGTATGGGTDYSANSQIIIPAGSTSNSITISSVSDNIDDDNETIIIDVASVVNAVEDGIQRQIVTIMDDDNPPTVLFAFNKATFFENGGTATLTATLNRASSKAITLDLEYTGTADLGVDYTASATTIAIPPGSLSGTITVTSINDTTSEGVETIVIGLVSSTNTATTPVTPATVSMTDIVGGGGGGGGGGCSVAQSNPSSVLTCLLMLIAGMSVVRVRTARGNHRA